MRVGFKQKGLFMVLAGALALAGNGAAKDAVMASVSGPYTGSTPVVVVNGNPYSSGTYAVGTIQLFYDVHAYQFPSGPFASFRLSLEDLQVNTTGQTPTYPVTLNLVQTGSANLALTPTMNSFSVTGPGWTASTAVTISIPSSVASNPSLNTDGTDLVGNLQLQTSPQGSKLDTVTTVQVHIRLAWPTACLKVYDFVTSQDLTSLATVLQVELFKHGPHAGETSSTQPYPQLSDNILVVNTCPTPESFDLLITMDPDFQITANSHGNSVFTYLKAGTADPSTFNAGSFGTGTPNGSNLCVGNVTIPAGDTLLATTHISIGTFPASSLPADSDFDFSGSLHLPNTACAGALDPLAQPNPGTDLIPFTVAP
jgi:hypothetical protein